MARRPIRSSQAISPFGVGAMMDFPGPESLIHAGLDAWLPVITHQNRIRPELRIDDEPALANRLGVDFFVTPPVSLEGAGAKLPWLRFPQWHQCPRCGRLHKAQLHREQAPVCGCQDRGPGVATRQVRFVAACRNGHLRDFPWVEWVAAKPGAGHDLVQLRRALEGEAILKLKRTGLSGGQGIRIVIEQPTGGSETPHILAERTLAGAFGGHADQTGPDATPLARIGIRCASENPALGISTGDSACRDCDAPLLVVLRGAGNLYFAEVESTIHVPDAVPGDLPEELRSLFEDPTVMRPLLREAARSRDGRLPYSEMIERFADRSYQYSYLAPSEVDIRAFVDAFNELEPFRQLTTDPILSEAIRQLSEAGPLDEPTIINLLEGIRAGGDRLGRWDVVPAGLPGRIEKWSKGHTRSDTQTGSSGDAGRRREFEVFSLDQHEVEGRPKSILKLRSQPIESYSSVVKAHFEHVALLDTLRETRVLKGYSRLFSLSRAPQEYIQMLWRRPPQQGEDRWLPAHLVYGEGIFLRFRTEKLLEWERAYGQLHHDRLKTVNRNLEHLAQRRNAEHRPVNARHVLVHTFAHLMINQLVFDSGYGSSSLRERLYAASPHEDDLGMAGVLIYTAAGDSEGTMGGLVRMGEPGNLERTLVRALESGLWCSSDPVCIESKGQGPDNCNLAACHSCALVPETSCEQQNRMLDRGVLIGTLSEPLSGYFSTYARPSQGGVAAVA